MRGPELEPPNGGEQLSVIVSRLLNAPCQAVFAAWTTVEQVQRWLCPEGATVDLAELDLRVGGAFRIEMLVHGVRRTHTGVYREIRPPQRLTFTWVSSHTHFRETLVTVDLQARGEQTELTITHTLLPDDLSRARHTRGWTQIMDHLVAYLHTR